MQYLAPNCTKCSIACNITTSPSHFPLQSSIKFLFSILSMYSVLITLIFLSVFCPVSIILSAACPNYWPSQRSQSSRSKLQLDSAMFPSNQTGLTQKVSEVKNSLVSVSSAMYANFNPGAEPRGWESFMTETTTTLVYHAVKKGKFLYFGDNFRFKYDVRQHTW